MNYGFDKDKFYIDFVPCQRPYGNMREEIKKKSLELACTSSKFILSLSGGIDSQSILHSFIENQIPLETAFLYLPGYNDNELEQVKILDKKYQRKTWIVDLNPFSVKEEITKLSIDLDIPAKNHLLQRKFLSLLPDDYDFIQMVHDPFVFPTNGKSYYIQSYYMPEISRQRSLDSLGRNGKNIFYGDSTEFLMSIIDDEIFKAAITSYQYYDGNGLSHPERDLKGDNRWDYYVKPLLYAKYWGDELIYFPKFAGFENIDYLKGNKHMQTRKHMISIEYQYFLNFNKNIGGESKRFFANVKQIPDE